MLVIDFAFFLLELGVGIWVSSLALMADAFHMVRRQDTFNGCWTDDLQLNDIISLAVGLWAVKAAQRSKSDKFSFGVCKIC
jgi:solute carrier family 30 (zinc transporter), member 1